MMKRLVFIITMFIIHVLFLVPGFRGYVLVEVYRLSWNKISYFLKFFSLSPTPFRSKCGERDELSPKRIKVEV